MPDRSKVTTQTERDNLVLQFGGWGIEANNLTSIKQSLIVEKPNNGCQMNNIGKRPRKRYKD